MSAKAFRASTAVFASSSTVFGRSIIIARSWSETLCFSSDGWGCWPYPVYARSDNYSMHPDTARYTKEVERVIAFARYEASSAGCRAIEPPHLHLALIREAKPLFEDRAGIKAEIEKGFRRWYAPSAGICR